MLKTIHLQGQKEPYVLAVQKNVECGMKVTLLDGNEVVSLGIIENGKYIALKYNDDFLLQFSGPGSYVSKNRKGTRIIVTDEYKSSSPTIYIFERHKESFWVRRVYSEQIQEKELPKEELGFVFEQLNSRGGREAIWNLYKKGGGLFDVVEMRKTGFYKHACTKSITNWVDGESFDIATDTDYTFLLRSGRFWLTLPNGTLKEVKSLPIVRTNSIVLDSK